MEAEIIESISRSIYRQFPELTGAKPKVRLQAVPQSNNHSTHSTYLLTFERKVAAAGGKLMSRWVRVTASGDGRIIKVSTSR